MKVKVLSTNPADTEAFAENIGARLRGGEVIELKSDLGGGKTTFTRGLVRGAGSENVVSSPTFTVSKLYQAGALEIHHFDFYRLQDDPGLVAIQLDDLVGDPSTVVIVEWGQAVSDVLPRARMVVEFLHENDTSRHLLVEYPDIYEYLFGEA